MTRHVTVVMLSVSLLSAAGWWKPSIARALPLDLPPGYYLDAAHVADVRPVWRDARDGDFTYSIKREFADSTEARLLAIAESCYPARDRLVDIAIANYYEMGSDTAKAPLWWCDGPGVRRVAYAVTARALDHYLDLTERFRNHDYMVAGGRGLYWTDLTYHATISPRTDAAHGVERRHVFVANLVLTWGYDDGVFLESFEAHRIVVLDPGGNVLSIEGDGDAVQDYAISSHQGIGRTEQVYR